VSFDLGKKIDHVLALPENVKPEVEPSLHQVGVSIFSIFILSEEAAPKEIDWVSNRALGQKTVRETSHRLNALLVLPV
jgi:hypothetical protein